MNVPLQQPQILTVKQFSQKFPAFTEASLRYLIFHSNSNGLHCCLRRIGRKILIIEAEFFNWLDSQDQGGSHA